MSTITQNSKLKTHKLGNLALPVCLTAMDACWVFIVAWIFASTVLEKVKTLPLPSPFVLAVLSLVAWGLAAFLLDKTRLATRLVQVIAMLSGVGLSVGIMFTLNPTADGEISVEWLTDAAAGVVLLFIMWLKGLYRAAGRPAFNEIYFDFQVGLGVVIVGALASPFFAGVRFGALWREIGTLPVWFFIFALVALALGNREVVRQEIGTVAGGSWGFVLTVSVGIIVLIGTLSAVLGGPNLLGLIQQTVQWAIVAVSATIYGTLYVVLWLWYVIFHPRLDGVLGSMPPTPTPGPVQGNQNSDILRMLQRQQQNNVQVPPEMVLIGSWLIAIALGAFALWLVSLGMKRFRKRALPNTIEERESLGSWALLAQQVRNLLDRLMSRFRKKAVGEAGHGEGDLAALAGRPEWRGTLSVRQIYANLLTLAGKSGYPRARHQTPVEYLAVLSGAMPTLRDEFRAITAAYLEARYGPLPASSPAVLSAAKAWERAEVEMQHIATPSARSHQDAKSTKKPPRS